jgi:transposase-like protein
LVTSAKRLLQQNRQAVEEVWPQTRGQRCWVQKTANVLNKLPKSQQSKAKRAWMAETKKDALAASDIFVETGGVKYNKAVECLVKDRDALLVFYDFPAEHWKHLRSKAHSPPHRALEGVSFEQDRARDDLQTRRGRREKLAPSRRS